MISYVDIKGNINYASVLNFSQAKAEPLWLQRRFGCFDHRCCHYQKSTVKFHRWNLGDGSISEDVALANVPDFTAIWR